MCEHQTPRVPSQRKGNTGDRSDVRQPKPLKYVKSGSVNAAGWC